jgi:GDP-4-dehydro-6-deoxy-D-mannose reductase
MYEIIITGADGFIGSNLTKFFTKKNKKILPIYKEFGDLKNKNIWNNVPAAKYLIHCAYKIDNKNKNPEKIFHQNIKVLKNAIDYCVTNQCMIIFPSTFLYGKNKKFSSEDSCPSPKDFYSLSKYVCEKMIYFKCKQKKIRSVILRLFNIYGDSQKKNYMIPRLFDEIIKGDKLNFYNFLRDYLHIDDVNTAFMKSINYKKKNFDIFNVGSGKSISAKNLAKIIGKITKKNIKFNELKNLDKNAAVNTKANINKAKKYLNWEPRVKIEQGLKNYYLSLKYQL